MITRPYRSIAGVTAPGAIVIAAVIGLLGGLASAFLTPIGQRMFSPKESKTLPAASVSQSTQAAGFAPLGNALVCWGQNPILPKGSDAHTRSFSFTFAKPFKSIPSVTTGINVVGSGYTFAVYNASVTEKTYTGLLVEQQSRQTEVPVSMSYTAIGQPNE